jgi:hypothetical protein
MLFALGVGKVFTPDVRRTMIQPSPQSPSDYQETEYQDPHYHDEEPDIQNDEAPRHDRPAGPRRKPMRFPQPKRRFEED